MSVVRSLVVPFALTLAAFGVVSAPSSLSAQSQLNSSEATEFLGVWDIPIEAPQGSANLQVAIRDQAGKVAVTMSVPQMPESVNITDVRRADSSLVMRYALDFQGTPINASVTLRPEGEGHVAALNFADGQFALTTPAYRQR